MNRSRCVIPFRNNGLFGLFVLLASSIAFAAAPLPPCLEEGPCSGGVAGSNEERVLAVLNGRSPPFAFNIPADPVASREVSVTSASQFNAEAAVPGTRIVINTSFSGNVQISADDIEVVMSNSATINGRLSLGNNSSYIHRLRWTGGNVGTITGYRFRDVLFDDVYALATPTTAPNSESPEHNFGAGWDGSGNPPFARLAIINSTLELRGDPAAPGNRWAWAFHNSPSYTNEDLIVGNVKMLSNHQNNRFQRIERLVIIDSVFNPDGASNNGMRIHRNSNHVWIRDSWSRGLMKLDEVNTSDQGPSVSNALFDNYDRYYSSYAFHGGHANSGVIRNSTLFGGTFSTGPMTSGGGNSSSSWNGTSVPSYANVGAIR